MFGIGGWEFVLISAGALLLFGPEKLPEFARTIGRFMRDFRRYQDLMQSTIRAEIFTATPPAPPSGAAQSLNDKIAASQARARGASTTVAEADEAESENAEVADDAPAGDDPIESAAVGATAADDATPPDTDQAPETDGATEPTGEVTGA